MRIWQFLFARNPFVWRHKLTVALAELKQRDAQIARDEQALAAARLTIRDLSDMANLYRSKAERLEHCLMKTSEMINFARNSLGNNDPRTNMRLPMGLRLPTKPD